MGTSTDERTISNTMTKQASAEATSNTRSMHNISANINGVEIIQKDMHVRFIEPHTGGRKKVSFNTRFLQHSFARVRTQST